MHTLIATMIEINDAQARSLSTDIMISSVKLSADLIKLQNENISTALVTKDAIDIIAEIYVFLHSVGVDEADIRDRVCAKYTKDIETWNHNKQLEGKTNNDN